MDFYAQRTAINNALNYTGAKPTDRPYVAMAAMALALARSLPLPPEPTDNPRLYLVTQHQGELDRAISSLNELVIIPVRHALELTVGLWLVRYYAAFPPAFDRAGLVHGFIDNYVGAPLCMIPEDLCRLNALREPIGEMVAVVAKHLEL